MREETESLIRLAQQGNRKAMEQLTEENSGLIHSVVNRFGNSRAEREDLFQIGAIGLIKAIKRFDDSFSVSFSTYAVPMILGEIRRFLRDDGPIRVSRRIKEQGILLRRAREKLTNLLGREPTISELAKETKISQDDIIMALEANTFPESLNAATEDGKQEMGDFIVGEESLEQCAVSRLDLQEALAKVNPRERQIIHLRYFAEKTQAQVAEVLGISQVQVSRLEKKVLLQLREKIS